MKKIYFLISFMLVFGAMMNAQQTVWLENFTYPDGTIQGSGTPPTWTRDVTNCILNPGDWVEVQSNVLSARDIDGEAVITTQSIDISSYVNVSISVDLAESGTLEASDYIRSYYSIDGQPDQFFTTNGNLNNDFTSAVASQPGLSGNTLVITFRMKNNQKWETYYMDNLLVEGVIPTPPVADFVAGNLNPISGQTVNFTDLSTNSPTSWSWAISPYSFTFVGGTSSTDQNPQVQFTAGGFYTISLTATNAYGSNTMTKVDYINVVDCTISAFPYEEQFNTGGTIPSCWQNVDNSGNGKLWEFNNPGGRTINTTTAANGFAIFDSDNYGNSTGAEDADLISPSFDFSGKAFAYLEFEHYFRANYGGAAEVFYSIDGGFSWISIDSWAANSTANAQTNTYDLSTFIAGQPNVKFKWNWTGDWSWWWAVDDVKVTVTPTGTAPPVADFSADNTTPSIGQTVNFTDLSTEYPTSWDWVITPATYSFVGGTNATSQNPQIQFSEGGDYNVQLTANNALGSDVMLKTAYISVPCNPLSIPWSEDFNTAGLLPGCWQNNDNTGNGKLWEFNNPGGLAFNSTTAANGFAIFDSDNYGSGTGAEDADLVSPVFDLTAETTVYLQFEHYFRSGYGGVAELFFSVDGGSNWTSLDSWNNSTANAQTEIYNVSADVAGFSQVMFLWKWTGDWSWWWAVDDIALTNAPIPTGLWTGVASDDWSDVTNWDDGNIPTLMSNITIPSGVSNFPVINELAYSKNLHINDGAEVRIIAGGDLQVAESVYNGEGASGIFRMDNGNCTILGDYYSEVGSTTDINNGTWSFYNWYRNLTSVWSKGIINLTNGTINAMGSIIWSSFNVTGTIDGPIAINIGGSLRNSDANWIMTNGTINMLGTDGAGPFYAMASSWGAGNKFMAFNLNINSPGKEFITNPPTDVTGFRVFGNLNVIAGFLNTEGNAGFMNDNDILAGDFIIGAAGEVTARVSGAFKVVGDANFMADPSDQASFIDNGKTHVIGAANVQQYLASERWHLVSPPVTGATIYTYLNIYLKSFNENNNTWNYLVQPTTMPMDVSQGFSAWASDALTGSTTVTYTGVLNTGDQTVPAFSYTPASPTVGWNLVGNPFPSCITWDNSWSKLNLSEWACIHNSGNDGCYNAATGTEWPNVGDMPNGALPPTQGFWVRATSAAAGLTIPNSQRVHKSQPIYKQSLVDIPQAIRLRVDGNNDFDVVLFQFTPDASNGFDQSFDLEKRWGYTESPQVYSIKTDNLYSVDALPEAYGDLVLPVGMEIGLDATCQLEATELYGFDGNLTVILEDIKEGVFMKLSENSVYEFTASTEDDPHRFNLHFKDVSTDISASSEKAVNIYSYEDNVYIQTPLSQLQNVVIYDLLGHEVYRKAGFDGDMNRISLAGKKGYFIVQAQTDKQVFSGKVFIQ